MIIVSFSNERVVFDMGIKDLIVLNQEYNDFGLYINRVTEDRDVRKLINEYHDIVRRSYRGPDFEAFKDSKNYGDLMNAVLSNPGDVEQYFMNGILYAPQSESDEPYVEMFIGGELT